MDLNKERKSKNSIKSPLEIRSLYTLLSVFYIWKSVRSQNFPFLSLLHKFTSYFYKETTIKGNTLLDRKTIMTPAVFLRKKFKGT